MQPTGKRHETDGNTQRLRTCACCIRPGGFGHLPELERRIGELVAGGERVLVVDLSGLTYVSSAGLRVFLSAAKKLKAAGGKLLLCSLGGMVQEVFVMSGFADILAIYDTLEKALKDV